MEFLEECIDITGHETKGKEEQAKGVGVSLMKAKLLYAVLLVFCLRGIIVQLNTLLDKNN